MFGSYLIFKWLNCPCWYSLLAHYSPRGYWNSFTNVPGDSSSEYRNGNCCILEWGQRDFGNDCWFSTKCKPLCRNERRKLRELGNIVYEFLGSSANIHSVWHVVSQIYLKTCLRTVLRLFGNSKKNSEFPKWALKPRGIHSQRTMWGWIDLNCFSALSPGGASQKTKLMNSNGKRPAIDCGRLRWFINNDLNKTIFLRIFLCGISPKSLRVGKRGNVFHIINSSLEMPWISRWALPSPYLHGHKPKSAQFFECLGAWLFEFISKPHNRV